MWEDDDQYDEYTRGKMDVMEVLSNAIKDRHIGDDNPSAAILNEILTDLYKQVTKTLNLS